MLQPSNRKYRKDHKGRNNNISHNKGVYVIFGKFGLKSISWGRITSRQIESARRAITHYIKRSGRIWIRIFPDKPITKKPAEVRMGNGKGNIEYYVFSIEPGKIIYEIDGVKKNIAIKAFKLASAKLPISTIFVSK